MAIRKLEMKDLIKVLLVLLKYLIPDNIMADLVVKVQKFNIIFTEILLEKFDLFMYDHSVSRSDALL